MGIVPAKQVRLGLLPDDEFIAAKNRGVSEFVRAAQEGSLERVNAAMSDGTHPNHKTPSGLSPLIVAARAGHDHIVRNILRAPIADVEINITDASGWTPLHYAVKLGRLSTVRILVQNGASLHARAHHGVTPLMVACSTGDTQVVTYLVSQDPAVTDAADAFGQTPLMVACDKGNTRIARQLIELGVDVRKRDLQGASALHYAAANGLIHATKLLLKAGAEPTRIDKFGNSALDVAVAQEQFAVLAVLRHAVSTQDWYSRAVGGSSRAPAREGSKFGGMHVLQRVLEAGAERKFLDGGEEADEAIGLG